MQIGTVLANFGYEWCVCSEHIARMVEKVNPDLFISAAASMQIPPPSPKSGITSLIYIHSPFCFSPRGYRHIQTWDNFLFAWTGADQLEERFQASGKRFRRLKTHFTIRKTDFCDSPKERIAFFGSLHDPRRREELAKLFQLLDKTDYCDFYGSARRWQKKKLKSWRGEVPFTGLTDVQDVMRPAGIALLLHSKHHFESGTSVSRDFEALSSSCVIITEKTAFMQENFGDCALFIDTDRPAEETFEQIDTHVKWIHAHPEEAIEMARRSHQIFCDKFSLEGECEKILKFVDEISAAQVQQGDGAVIHT
jgi:glycosyltransferase involved in cell wall biosynthesis